MKIQKITVLLADDHLILRQGLRRILESEADITVVGEASWADTESSVKKLEPDVVIMNVSAETDGVGRTRQIVSSVSSRVLILTQQLENRAISEAISAGAAGYLAKDSSALEL